MKENFLEPPELQKQHWEEAFRGVGRRKVGRRCSWQALVVPAVLGNECFMVPDSPHSQPPRQLLCLLSLIHTQMPGRGVGTG